MPRIRHHGSQIKAKEAKENHKGRKRCKWVGGRGGGGRSEREKEEKLGSRAMCGLGSQPNPDLSPISTNTAM